MCAHTYPLTRFVQSTTKVKMEPIYVTSKPTTSRMHAKFLARCCGRSSAAKAWCNVSPARCWWTHNDVTCCQPINATKVASPGKTPSPSNVSRNMLLSAIVCMCGCGFLQAQERGDTAASTVYDCMAQLYCCTGLCDRLKPTFHN